MASCVLVRNPTRDLLVSDWIPGKVPMKPYLIILKQYARFIDPSGGGIRLGLGRGPSEIFKIEIVLLFIIKSRTSIIISIHYDTVIEIKIEMVLQFIQNAISMSIQY